MTKITDDKDEKSPKIIKEVHTKQIEDLKLHFLGLLKLSKTALYCEVQLNQINAKQPL